HGSTGYPAPETGITEYFANGFRPAGSIAQPCIKQLAYRKRHQQRYGAHAVHYSGYSVHVVFAIGVFALVIVVYGLMTIGAGLLKVGVYYQLFFIAFFQLVQVGGQLKVIQLLVGRIGWEARQ